MGEGVRRYLSRAAAVVLGKSGIIQRDRLLAQHQQHVERGGEQHVIEPELIGLGRWWVEWRWERWRGWKRVLVHVTKRRSRGSIALK
jgi:hypothetical protein